MAYALFPDTFPVLGNASLTLRALSEEDLPAWFERLTDAESAKLAGDPVAESIQACIDGLQHHRDAFRDKQAIRWSIVLNDNASSIGSIGLTGVSVENRACEMGAAINRQYWDRGITTDAGELVLEYAFKVLDLERIQADVLASNIGSIRVLEKLGFQREGTLRGYRIIDGERRDGHIYGLLRL